MNDKAAGNDTAALRSIALLHELAQGLGAQVRESHPRSPHHDMLAQLQAANDRLVWAALQAADRWTKRFDTGVRRRWWKRSLPPRSMTIADDGRGFDLAKAHAQAHRSGNIGLMSMRERAAMIGGDLEIRSAPGRGAMILASIPMAA